MPTVAFEPASPVSERTQIYAIDRARYYGSVKLLYRTWATGCGCLFMLDICLHSSSYAALHQLAFVSRLTGGIILLVFKDWHCARTFRFFED